MHSIGTIHSRYSNNLLLLILLLSKNALCTQKPELDPNYPFAVQFIDPAHSWLKLQSNSNGYVTIPVWKHFDVHIHVH
jgi:hypothetical protein